MWEERGRSGAPADFTARWPMKKLEGSRMDMRKISNATPIPK
jgi:hypothetical protein